MAAVPIAFGAPKGFRGSRKGMIETRPKNAVTGGVDSGSLEACRISATAVSARGYNILAWTSATSPSNP